MQNAALSTNRLIAHRGASKAAPENTLAAIALAAEQGASWVELDATVSACGTSLIFHDDTLERCSNGHGYVCETDWRIIETLDSGRWFSSRYAQEPIPRLDSALRLCHTLDLGVHLEIKCTTGWEQPTATQVCRDAAAFVDKLPIQISSFSVSALEIAKQQLPSLPRALLVDVIPPNWQKYTDNLALEGVHFCAQSIHWQHYGQAVLDAGLTLRAYTVDTSSLAMELFTQGVHAVFTNDYPKLAMALQQHPVNQHSQQ